MKTENHSPKYKDIMQTAHDLFWKHGFKRVSVEEICRKAGVSKMTFYRFFPNKIELAKKVYTQEVDKGVYVFKTIMEEKSSSEEKMKKILMMKFEGTNNISREFIMDFYSDQELGLKHFIEQKTTEVWQQLIQDFKTAQEKGIFRKDFKPEFILFLSQRIMDMLTDENLLKLYKNQQEVIMELTNFFVYGISPQE
ncbi:MAG TPA: TetR/AcrR family transcriptional regulator [Bacteroidales bacterium]|nr:TetR/AcrR family transcriptional regulator [Bacteroidales bacterium]